MTGSPRGRVGQRVVELDRCESTNDEAARLARDGAVHGTAVIAAEQTRGRGRRGRQWHSPGGSLYTSMLLRPGLPPDRVPPLSLLTGLAVARTARSYGADATIKWPNDILIGDRKLGGVLCEMSSHGDAPAAVIVGVGVNIDRAPMPPQLAATAISLAECSSTHPTARAFADQLFAAFDPLLREYVDCGSLRAALPAIRELCATIGRSVRTEHHRGVAVDIDEDGALIIEADDGTRVRVVSGEVFEFPCT